MSIYKGNTLIAGGSQQTPLLSFVWADHLLSDIPWLRADTFSWQAGSVYTAVYSHLTSDISGKSLQSETIGGTTIQFYLADDGHKICPANQESNVSAIYSATGVAWYYILDTVNTRFKLPRSTNMSNRLLAYSGSNGTKWWRVYSDGWVEQGDGNPGSFGTITLPITMANTTYSVDITPTDTYYVPRITAKTTTSFTSNGRCIDNSGLTGTTGFTSWTVSGQSSLGTSNVTPQQKYLYFYVGQFTQSAISQTAGLNAELFNGKADINTVVLKGHQVIEFQAPTADNNYTWYRKYADGWVEQGGFYTSASSVGTYYINLVVTMANTNYFITGMYNQAYTGDWTSNTSFNQYSTTQIKVSQRTSVSGKMTWQVTGMYAQ